MVEGKRIDAFVDETDKAPEHHEYDACVPGSEMNEKRKGRDASG